MNMNNSSNSLNLNHFNLLAQLSQLQMGIQSNQSYGYGMSDPLSNLYHDAMGLGQLGLFPLMQDQRDSLNSSTNILKFLAQSQGMAFQPNYMVNNFQNQMYQQLSQNHNTFLSSYNRLLQTHNEDQLKTQEKEKTKESLKCFNKICSYRGDKLFSVESKSKTNPGQLNFCDRCFKQYQRKNYCDFCEQISSNRKNEQDDQEWICCDLCCKWNHIVCEAQYGNQNIQKEKDETYYCQYCAAVSQITEPATSAESDPYIQEKQRVRPNQTNYIKKVYLESSREKNINLMVTKDSRNQITLRVNLLEEEIKGDLDKMRCLNASEQTHQRKKLKKNAIQLSPLKQKSPQSPTEKKEEICRPRRNTKISYRSMVGEW